MSNGSERLSGYEFGDIPEVEVLQVHPLFHHIQQFEGFDIDSFKSAWQAQWRFLEERPLMLLADQQMGVEGMQALISGEFEELTEAVRSLDKLSELRSSSLSSVGTAYDGWIAEKTALVQEEAADVMVFVISLLQLFPQERIESNEQNELKQMIGFTFDVSEELSFDLFSQVEEVIGGKNEEQYPQRVFTSNNGLDLDPLELFDGVMKGLRVARWVRVNGRSLLDVMRINGASSERAQQIVLGWGERSPVDLARSGIIGSEVYDVESPLARRSENIW